MSDAISRDAALEMISRTKEAANADEAGFTKSQRKAIKAIADLFSSVFKDLPSLDVAPVVRCKDCIHAVAITNLTIANRCGLGQKNCMRQRGDDGFGFTGVSVVYPDGFCDEGARMDVKSEEEADGSQTD